MGRRKIKIERIQENRTRNVTLQKRKIGVMKKAYELSVLCNCEVAVIVLHDGKVSQYSSKPIDQLLQHFMQTKGRADIRTNQEMCDKADKNGSDDAEGADYTEDTSLNEMDPSSVSFDFRSPLQPLASLPMVANGAGDGGRTLHDSLNLQSSAFSMSDSTHTYMVGSSYNDNNFGYDSPIPIHSGIPMSHYNGNTNTTNFEPILSTHMSVSATDFNSLPVTSLPLHGAQLQGRVQLPTPVSSSVQTPMFLNESRSLSSSPLPPYQQEIISQSDAPTYMYTTRSPLPANFAIKSVQASQNDSPVPLVSSPISAPSAAFGSTINSSQSRSNPAASILRNHIPGNTSPNGIQSNQADALASNGMRDIFSFSTFSTTTPTNTTASISTFPLASHTRYTLPNNNFSNVTTPTTSITTLSDNSYCINSNDYRNVSPRMGFTTTSSTPHVYSNTAHRNGMNNGNVVDTSLTYIPLGLPGQYSSHYYAPDIPTNTNTPNTSYAHSTYMSTYADTITAPPSGFSSQFHGNDGTVNPLLSPAYH